MKTIDKKMTPTEIWEAIKDVIKDHKGSSKPIEISLQTRGGDLIPVTIKRERDETNHYMEFPCASSEGSHKMHFSIKEPTAVLLSDMIYEIVLDDINFLVQGEQKICNAYSSVLGSWGSHDKDGNERSFAVIKYEKDFGNDGYMPNEKVIAEVKKINAVFKEDGPDNIRVLIKNKFGHLLRFYLERIVIRDREEQTTAVCCYPGIKKQSHCLVKFSLKECFNFQTSARTFAQFEEDFVEERDRIIEDFEAILLDDVADARTPDRRDEKSYTVNMEPDNDKVIKAPMPDIAPAVELIKLSFVPCESVSKSFDRARDLMAAITVQMEAAGNIKNKAWEQFFADNPDLRGYALSYNHETGKVGFMHKYEEDNYREKLKKISREVNDVNGTGRDPLDPETV